MPPRNGAEYHLTYLQSKGNDCQMQMNQDASALVKFRESWSWDRWNYSLLYTTVRRSSSPSPLPRNANSFQEVEKKVISSFFSAFKSILCSELMVQSWAYL